MNIAFLTPEYPHPKVAQAAGLGTSIKNLTTALVEKGVKVTVFVYGQNKQEVILEDGVVLHLIKNRKYKLFGWLFHRKYIQKYCNSVIKRDNIELIEAPDWTGITAFMQFQVPLVIRFHGSDTYFCHLERRRQKLKNFWLESLAVKKAKAFIAPSTFAGEVSKNLFKIKNKEIITIHNGLSLKDFNNDSPVDFEEGMILYIGTLIRKKGVFELPEIFNTVRKKIPHAKLVLIGSDSFDIKTNSISTWQLMQKQFKEDDLNSVEYLGKMPYNKVQFYIKKANVCVFPTFAETLGMVTIESMAMQKAVVNSNIGWSQELITDGENGFLVHPQNHDLYANQIIKLLQNNTLALEIGKKARIRAEDNFDINKLVVENIDFYNQMLNTQK